MAEKLSNKWTKMQFNKKATKQIRNIIKMNVKFHSVLTIRCFFLSIGDYLIIL